MRTLTFTPNQVRKARARSQRKLLRILPLVLPLVLFLLPLFFLYRTALLAYSIWKTPRVTGSLLLDAFLRIGSKENWDELQRRKRELDNKERQILDEETLYLEEYGKSIAEDLVSYGLPKPPPRRRIKS